MIEKRKKIVFIIPSLGAGGAERVIVSLANEYSILYDVTIISLFKKSSFYEIKKTIQLNYCEEKPVQSSNILSGIRNNFLLYKKIKSILSSLKPEVVIAFTTTANIIGILAAKATNTRIIISERANPYLFVPNKFWRVLRKLTYPKAEKLVVQSDLSKQFYKSFVSEEKIAVLPNPLSKTLEKKRNSNAIRENIILNVGRLDKNKSQDLLIKSFAQAKLKNWKLVLVGDGEQKMMYQELVNKLKINDQVTFTGTVSNTEHYYNKAKLFAFTSKSEGFPNALIEAMYFGNCCISTDCPSGPSTLISHEHNGVLIPIGDQHQLTKHLISLTENEALRNYYATNAMVTSESYTLTNVFKLWLKLTQL